MNKHTMAIHESTRRVLSLSVLISYLAVLLLFPLHELSHQVEQEEVCYEDNACHLRLVHHDAENGCDHESHVAEEKLTCELCALRHMQSASEDHHWSFEALVFSLARDFIVDQCVDRNSFVTSILVRGPPLNS